MEGIRFNLEQTLDFLGMTRNKLSVESKTRQATVLDLAAGESKTVKLETLVAILDALNETARRRGMDRRFVIDDVIQYVAIEDRNPLEGTYARTETGGIKLTPTETGQGMIDRIKAREKEDRAE